MSNAERIKTNQKCIYFNKTTGLYDVKCNYSVSNPSTGETEHRAKWIYGVSDLQSAKDELEFLKARTGSSSSASLDDIYKLWLDIACAKQLSPVSVRNTRNSYNRICRFLPADTKLDEITEGAYYRLISSCRDHGYSNETIRDINATIKKFFNLAERKHIISNNVFHYCETVKIKRKDDHRVIEPAEMSEINAYFSSSGKTIYKAFFNLLYYTGIRVGEALALTRDDIGEYSYQDAGHTITSHIITVNKSFDSGLRLIKSTKNNKNRIIPLTDKVYELICPLLITKTEETSAGDRLFVFNQSSTSYVLRTACRAIGINPFRCHDFRHTFISNLVRASVPLPVIEKVSGDTQSTILSRYSHSFRDDEVMVLDVMSRL